MNMTTGQQRLLFAVVALALIGLGYYLVSGHRQGAVATPSPTPSPTAPAAASAAVSAGQPSPVATSASVPPATVPPPGPVPTVAGGADIYQWLPFTQADLTAAAKTTVAFAAAYSTWSYTESKQAYTAKLAALVMPKEATTLGYDYGTPGVAGPRVADKQVSTGSGTIDEITSFGASPTSITFAVTIDQKVTSTKGTSPSVGKYAVTVVSSGGGWRVNDIELTGLGNQ